MDQMVAGKCAGDHVQRRRTMELGGDGLERERGKGERSGGRVAHPQRARELGGDGEGRRRRVRARRGGRGGGS